MIDLVFENQTEYREWTDKFFRAIINKALVSANIDTKQVEMGIQLVSPARSQELNLKYRNKDKPTDVLSFPLEDRTLDKYGILPLGDIFICPDLAVAQAIENGISSDEEMARLAVHGVLHLLGYDHPDDEVSGPRLKRRGEKMFKLENQILSKLDK